jgi:murein DD-endopeptidase MepM/ murein hydrolase activator NlpD
MTPARPKRYSVLIVAHDGSRVVRFGVDHATVRRGLIAIAALVPLFGLACLGYNVVGMTPAATIALVWHAEPAVALAEPTDVAPVTEPEGSPPTQAPARPVPTTAASARPASDDSRSRVEQALIDQAAIDRALVERVSRRLPEIEAEVQRWRDVHANIRKAWKAKSPAPPDDSGVKSADPPTATDPSTLGARLDRLATIVRDEGRKLRGLERFMNQVGATVAALPLRWPVRSSITSEFGRRSSPVSGAREFHTGIDIAAKTGTRVVAPSRGTVVFAGTTPDYGNMVVLDHGNEIKTRFAHLHAINVAVGGKVERGDSIALTGNTGRSTGPHLHYEVLVNNAPVDPRKYLLE